MNQHFCTSEQHTKRNLIDDGTCIQNNDDTQLGEEEMRRGIKRRQR
jgi:hypothetical protein